MNDLALYLYSTKLDTLPNAAYNFESNNEFSRRGPLTAEYVAYERLSDDETSLAKSPLCMETTPNPSYEMTSRDKDSSQIPADYIYPVSGSVAKNSPTKENLSLSSIDTHKRQDFIDSIEDQPFYHEIPSEDSHQALSPVKTVPNVAYERTHSSETADSYGYYT